MLNLYHAREVFENSAYPVDISACYNKQIHFHWTVEGNVRKGEEWKAIYSDDGFRMGPCDGSCEIEPPPAIARIIARIERKRQSE